MQNEMKDHYIRFDWAIKRLLRQKANFNVLEGFLTVFLQQPITIVELLESESNASDERDKYNRVDIKALNDKGEVVLVEVQNSHEADYLERLLFGVAKTITDHMELGRPYREVKKVYSISIVYFDLGKGADYLYHGQNRFVGVHTNDQLKITTRERKALVTRRPEEIFPEYYLIRVNEFNRVATSPMEEWVQYLKEGTIRPDTTVPGLREAREKLRYYSMSAEERRAYEAHMDALVVQTDVISTARREGLYDGRLEGLAEGMAKGRAEGLEAGRAEGLEAGRAEGREEGRAEEKRAIARSLKGLGLPVADICRSTGLSADEVEGL